LRGTEDPKGFLAGDSHLARYGFNDPVSNADPTGLDIWIAGGGDHTGIVLDVWDDNGRHLGALSVDFRLEGWDGEDSSCSGNVNPFWGAGQINFSFTPGVMAHGKRRVAGTIEDDRRLLDWLVNWTAGSASTMPCKDGRTSFDVMKASIMNLTKQGGIQKYGSRFSYGVAGRNCNAFTYYALQEYLGEEPFDTPWGSLGGRGLTGDQLLGLWRRDRFPNGTRRPRPEQHSDPKYNGTWQY